MGQKEITINVDEKTHNEFKELTENDDRNIEDRLASKNEEIIHEMYRKAQEPDAESEIKLD